jgi:YegS/Rv2252/BmrU family lipid kinase
MPNSSTLTFLFAINPVSGGTDKSAWEAEIQQFFAQSPHRADQLTLTGQDDETTLAERIRATNPDRLVAVGGDGTVKLVAEAAIAAKLPLGILPAGSANGMARELALPLTPAEALDVLVNGQETAVDAILVNQHDLCLHLSDIGLNAQLVKYAQVNNWRGKFGYARAALRVLLRRRLIDVRIRMDGEVVERKAFMVVLANARVYGTGAVINPDGNLSDGRFEVVVLRRLSLWAFLNMFWRFRPFDPTNIEIFPTTEVVLNTKRPAHFQVDGEYRGKVAHLEARVQPGKLVVLMPVGLPPA